MSNHEKTTLEHAVREIASSVERACEQIRKDARKTIADLRSRANAISDLETTPITSFDRLFATEIVTTRHGDLPLPLANARIEFLHGIGMSIGAPTGAAGLPSGKRFRMIVA
jgi:hypothetical protein